MVSGGFGGFWGFRPSQNCFYKIKYFFITLKKKNILFDISLRKTQPYPPPSYFFRK